jgi:hypothetical protein
MDSNRRSTITINIVGNSATMRILFSALVALLSSSKLFIHYYGVDSFTIAPYHHQPSTTTNRNIQNRFPLRRRNSMSDNTIHSSSTNNNVADAVGERYICLFDDYNKVKGSYFNALFDQMFEQTRINIEHSNKHVVFLTTKADIQNIINNKESRRNDDENNVNADSVDNADDDHDHDNDDNVDNDNTKIIMEPILNDLKLTLDLNDIPELFIMDDWNPLKIQERFSDSSSSLSSQKPLPSIVWLYGNYNTFHTRHLLRISGFDKFIQKQCASSVVSSSSSSSSSESSSESSTSTTTTNTTTTTTSMYIGEGTGALCVSYTMDIATTLSSKVDDKYNNDPKYVVPEYQKFGLQLLSYGDGSNSDNSDNSDDNKNSNIDIDIQDLQDDQVFVWSQQQEVSATATKFIITPSKRGTIEKYETPNQLPPLVTVSNDGEGVQCDGEPSIDPSKSIQVQDIGISEDWW